MTGVCIAVVGLALAAGCGGSSTDSSSPGGPGPQTSQYRGPDQNPAPGRDQAHPPPCDRTLTRAEEVPAALDGVSPGTTLCFNGGDFGRTDVLLTHSGAANRPITLVSDQATVHSIHVTADHVAVEGFTVTGGDGIFLRGADLAIRRNTVHDTQRGGITCERCENSIIDSNTVAHVDTVGIWISGQRVEASRNTVTGTVARDNGDADGMRFFGNGHRITGNTVTDISDQGYGNPPHPDCFQTYDSDGPPTFDVLIAGNTCRNVGAQCLIATGDRNANGAAPTGGPSISFVDNTCAANGAQAVNIRRWPNVEIRDNRISGPNVTRGIIIIEGSTGCVVVGNTTDGNRPTLDIDRSSQRGAQVEHNTPS
ncbi:MAG TPA: right-handed parallel beta-helix repeat-containing protein [Pseudonocardiaceae bacterium]|nr:right-handed parallel beta-helix repeat-containing protein [Pseudonocardiaceae bacterium]